MPRISVTEYFTAVIMDLNANLERLCTETDTYFLKALFTAVEDPDRPMTLKPEITRDGAHFNLLGYEILGNAIVGLLRDVVKQGSRILLIGDSITAGYPEYEPLLLGKGYGDEKHSFGYYLRTMLDCEVVNCGISGDLTSSMVSRLPVHLQEEPDLVIMQGGANDAYYSMEMRSGLMNREMEQKIVQEMAGNFRSMVEECQEAEVGRAIIPLLPFYGEFVADG